MRIIGTIFAFLIFAVGISPASAEFGELHGTGTDDSVCIPSTSATAFFARVTTLDAPHTDAYCRLLNSLDHYVITPKLDVLVILGTQSQAIALNNLVSSSWTPTIVGSGGTFVTDHGWTAVVGTTNTYINAAFAMFPIAGLQYQQNFAHIGMWSNSNIAGTVDPCMGQFVSSNGTQMRLGTGQSAWMDINSTGNDNVSFTTSNSQGWFVANRNDNADTYAFQNGIFFGSNSLGSHLLTFSGDPMFVGAINIGAGVPSNSCGIQIAAYSIGGGLTIADEANLYGALRAFGNAVGWP